MTELEEFDNKLHKKNKVKRQSRLFPSVLQNEKALEESEEVEKIKSFFSLYGVDYNNSSETESELNRPHSNNHHDNPLGILIEIQDDQDEKP